MRLRGADAARRVVKIDDLSVGDLFLPFSDEVYHGERVGLIGPNGTGKSTFLKVLAGVRTPDAGSIAGTAVKYRVADKGLGEPDPAVVRGVIGVIEGQAIKGHVVHAVFEAPKEGLGVAQAGTVGTHTECAGTHLEHIRVVAGLADEVADVV